jgi:hypothetical protein
LNLSRASVAALIALALMVPPATVVGAGQTTAESSAGGSAATAKVSGAAAKSMPGVTIKNATSPRVGSFRGDVRRLPQVGPKPSQTVHPTRPRPSSTKVPLSGSGTVEPAAPPSSRGVTPAGGTMAGLSFKGLDFTNWGAGWPPDTTGDVGPNHYIQVVNTSIGIFSKAGTRLAAFTYNTFFAAGSTGTLCDTSNQGDPIVVYDQMADRWIISDFAFVGDGSVPPFYECLAISKTGDPINGGWWFYAIRTDDTLHPWFADYPKMGIWPDGLYMSANMFDSTFAFREVRAWAFNRDDLYSGAAVRMVVIDLGTTTYFSLLPSNLRGTPPPAGRENFFISESETTFLFHVFKFHVDYSGTGSTFTGPTNVSQTIYTVAADTVPSPGNAMDSLADRLMQWAQYRNIGGTESLWVSHTVRTGASTAPTGIQWAQINVTGGTIVSPPVQQQIYGNLGSDGVHRWMGSLAVDKDGGMALGYSASSATLEPDIRVNGRIATDPLGTLPGGEISLLTGVTRGHQSGSCGGTCIRWGDYSSMSIDPDGCTYWYTQEYYETSGLNWQTRIGSFSLAGCTPLPVPPSIAINDVTLAEGNAGTTAFTFTITRSGDTSGSSSVDYRTNDGSATAPSDYTALPPTTVTFAATETTKPVTVNVNGDTTVESDETFTVDLSNPVGATIADSQGLGTITNDDTASVAPTLSINDVTLNEGNAGTTAYTFTITRSGDTSGSSSVDYRTNDGSATAPSDYTAVPPTTVTFAATETTKTVTVNVNGDTTFESGETFTVDLSNPVGATIADAQGLGTITNDDAAPPPAPWPFVWASTTHAPPETNRRVAGDVVRVKFTIGGYQGLDVFASGWPKSKHYRCSTGELLPRGRTRTQPLGNAGLSYDTVSGVYTYAWQTAAGWAGTCRQFQVRLTDGSFYFAKFKFRAPPATAASAAIEAGRRRH